MFLHDLVDIRQIDKGVPDPFGVHHRHGRTSAAIHAACLVHTHLADTGQPRFFHLALAVVVGLFRAMLRTTVVTIVALIQAKKDVVLVIGSGRIGHGAQL